MQKLIDKLALSGLCLLALSFTELSWRAVVAMLAAVAVSALCVYFEGRIADILCAAYVALCIIMPEAAIFLPLVVYDCAGRELLFFRFCWVLALPVALRVFDPRIPAAALISSGAAFLLQYRSASIEKTRDEFFTLTDDARERVTIMERQNRELAQRQDYEVRLATLAERNRIAREIHDSVGHLLTRSLLQLGALRVTRSADPGLEAELGNINVTLSDAMDSIRSSVHDLHDEALDLEQHIEALIDRFEFCHVHLRYDAGELPGAIKTCFSAIVREALSNIAKHSGASEARITVTEHPAFCQLIIEDDGTAMPSNASGGIGLHSMSERVDALGGVFRTERERGFRIFISVPKSG